MASKSTIGQRNPAGLVNRYIGTSYDTVKFVADNMDKIDGVYEALDDFGSYLGVHESVPSGRSENEPLQVGDYYFDSTREAFGFITELTEDIDPETLQTVLIPTVYYLDPDEIQALADQATLKADEAAVSATNAATSEVNAKLSEDNAKISEDNAAQSAIDAQNIIDNYNVTTNDLGAVTDVNEIAPSASYDSATNTLTINFTTTVVVDNLSDSRTDAALSANKGSELKNSLDNINTAIGKTDGETDLGTFTGETISDNSTVKGALQELETKLDNTTNTAVNLYDGLDSTSTSEALTANQGNVLDNKVSALDTRLTAEENKVTASSLEGLTDTSIGAPSTIGNGQSLTYDAASGLWIPQYSTAAIGITEFNYIVDTNNTATPASGAISLDNSDPALVTTMYINKFDSTGGDITLFLDELKTGDWLNLYDRTDSGIFERYDVSGAISIVGDVYHVPVVLFDNSVTRLNDADQVKLFWRRIETPQVNSLNDVNIVNTSLEATLTPYTNQQEINEHFNINIFSNSQRISTLENDTLIYNVFDFATDDIPADLFDNGHKKIFVNVYSDLDNSLQSFYVRLPNTFNTFVEGAKIIISSASCRFALASTGSYRKVGDDLSVVYEQDEGSIEITLVTLDDVQCAIVTNLSKIDQQIYTDISDLQNGLGNVESEISGLSDKVATIENDVNNTTEILSNEIVQVGTVVNNGTLFNTPGYVAFPFTFNQVDYPDLYRNWFGDPELDYSETSFINAHIESSLTQDTIIPNVISIDSTYPLYLLRTGSSTFTVMVSDFYKAIPKDENETGFSFDDYVGHTDKVILFSLNKLDGNDKGMCVVEYQGDEISEDLLFDSMQVVEQNDFFINDHSLYNFGDFSKNSFETKNHIFMFSDDIEKGISNCIYISKSDINNAYDFGDQIVGKNSTIVNYVDLEASLQYEYNGNDYDFTALTIDDDGNMIVASNDSKGNNQIISVNILTNTINSVTPKDFHGAYTTAIPCKSIDGNVYMILNLGSGGFVVLDSLGSVAYDGTSITGSCMYFAGGQDPVCYGVFDRNGGKPSDRWEEVYIDSVGSWATLSSVGLPSNKAITPSNADTTPFTNLNISRNFKSENFVLYNVGSSQYSNFIEATVSRPSDVTLTYGNAFEGKYYVYAGEKADGTFPTPSGGFVPKDDLLPSNPPTNTLG